MQYIAERIMMQTSTVVVRSRRLGSRETAYEWSQNKNQRSMERLASDFGDFVSKDSAVTGKTLEHRQ
jgi:hypothetical protein